MASYESETDDVFTTICQTIENIEVLEKVLEKLEHVHNGSEIDLCLTTLAGTKITKEAIEKNVKEANFKKEKAADDTFVSDEVMEDLNFRQAITENSIGKMYDWSEQMLKKYGTLIPANEKRGEKCT